MNKLILQANCLSLGILLFASMASTGLSATNTFIWDASGANPTTPTDGAGTWSTGNANWSSGTSDSVWSSGSSAIFGANNGAAGAIANSGVTVSNITFNPAGSGGYIITGSTLTLTGSPTLTVASGVFATNSSILAGTGFTKAGNGTLALSPSSAAQNVGQTVVNAGTLFLAAGGVSSLNDDLIVNVGGVVQVAQGSSIPVASRFFINGGNVTNMSTAATTENHNIYAFDNNGIHAASAISQLNVTNFDFRSGTEAFPKFPSTMTTNFSVKSTPGTMIVQTRANSSGANGIAGLRLNAGTFICDYPNPAPNSDAQGGAKYISSAQMTLAGGTLFQRFAANANRTETAGGVLVNPGATAVLVTNNAVTANNYTFAQGAITRTIGGTVDYAVGGTSTGAKACTTTTANANGILGGYATYAGADWAAGTTIVPYAAYTTSTDPAAWAAANNISLTGNPITNVPDLTTINTLKLGGTSAVSLAGTLTLSAGGLLVTGGGANSISGGTLKGASGADLIVHQYASGDLTISSTLADNGTATSLAKSGSGKLVITGTNSMTGTNYLNGGSVEVSDLTKLASGPLIMNNGALRYTGSDAASTRGITLNGSGGTIDVVGSTTLTQSAAVKGGGGFNSPLTPGLNLGDWGGLTKIGTGTLVLNANNVYNGPTVVSNGVLLVNGINSLTGASGITNYLGGGSFTVYGTLGGTGTISGPITVKNGGTISPGNSIGTFTCGTNLTLESGGIARLDITNGGSGDLLAVNGNLAIGSNCSIALNIIGTSLEPGTNILITYSGTKSGSFNGFTIVGGTLDSSLSIDETISGQIRLVAVPQVAITTQPTNEIVSVGAAASFNVVASGSAAITYQWYRYSDGSGSSPVAQTDATNASFTIANAQSSDSGFYGVVVTNNYNSVTSSIATLLVGNVVPELSGPTNMTVIAGNNVTFNTSVVLANPAPTFQWQTNGIDVTGATGTSLTLNNIPFAYDGMQVSVIASNVAGATTNTATLTVIVTPAISPQPTNLTVNAGDTANFVSGATGVPLPSLQWYKNNTAIGGATGSTLTIPNAQGSNIAGYKFVASNAAGSATSVVATLTVNSTSLVATALTPGNGAAGTCYDTPLYVTFNSPVSIANAGRIRIDNATNSTTPVDTIDMGSNSVVISSGIGITNNIQPHNLFSGDSQVINYFPVIISGSTAAIYPHLGVMTSNQTYYVVMENGVVADSSGAFFQGISDTNAWRFTTKPAGPVNPTNLVVAADGSGDFVTVQGAVDSVTPGNTNYTLVNIRNGNYVEIVDISGKNNITFRGQSRTGTLVGYPNNNNLTGTTAARMAFKVNSADIHLENLTITNGTPQGGSQAEALLIYNNGLRCIVNNCDIASRQDTILINASTSQGYFYNCKVTGNFDYVWGVGIGYFHKCVFHTLTNTLSSSYNLTAARTLTSGTLSTNTPWTNPNGTTFSANGFSFVCCAFEADAGVAGITLAGSNGTAGGVDSWIDCLFDTNAYISPSTALSNTYVFWQAGNSNITGLNPISYTNVQTIAVTNNDPRFNAATTPSIWFYGWSPLLAPNIISQPTDLTVNANASASFSVGATGIPDPTYQWLKNGTNVSGQTASALTIPNASGLDIGSYSVIAANGAGSVTSSVAMLNVIAPSNPPALGTISVLGDGSAQFSINGVPGSAGFSYRVWASTNVMLSPITSTWTLLTNDSFGTGPTTFVDSTASGFPQRFYIITVP